MSLRNTITFFLLIGTLFAGRLQAQVANELWQYQGGIMFEYVDIYDKLTNQPFGGLSYTCFSVGAQYQIAQTNDFASLTVNPNASFGFVLSNFGGAVLGQVPVYLMGRIGANSTHYNENRVGLGLGIGPKYTYMGYRFSGFSVNQGFLAPSVVVDLTINSRGGGNKLIIRFHANINRTDGDFDTLPAEYTNFGFGFLYSFDDLF